MKSSLAHWSRRRYFIAIFVWSIPLGLGLVRSTNAQSLSLSIDWFSIDGGGSTSTGGLYELVGVIGQPDANPELLAGGNFTLSGGFLTPRMPTLAAPVLSIRLQSTDAARVYWPSPSAGFRLEMNTDLSGPNWVAAPEDVGDDGVIKFIDVAPANGNRFYRLTSP